MITILAADHERYSIGQWPLTFGRTTTTHTVYLAEETHFDVILGWSFMEKRGVKTDPLDMTSVARLDTGESLEGWSVANCDGGIYEGVESKELGGMPEGTRWTLMIFLGVLSDAGRFVDGARVDPGWLKYEWNGTVLNLDDDSNYTIFIWRQQQPRSQPSQPSTSSSPISSSPSSALTTPNVNSLTTLHFKPPTLTPLAYLNPTFYLFRPSPAQLYTPSLRDPSTHRAPSTRSRKFGKSKVSTASQFRNTKRTSRNSTRRMVCGLLSRRLAPW
ncbi:hypothetical protein M422DRAFT_275246 [Sphaerobolus stellatus SS14]|uniref:Uncharacterized protein n=1 Tax=Sphaerobolus stellatus (strain SS14) TaxID=990650 RepID=A0A0C9UF21_SPHS4|nr:hypothetical protein M422DRAFT_275246 [Sphaerobolus stellatus SS14]